MRPLLLSLLSLVTLLVCTTAATLHAQTLELQTEVEAKLWFERSLDWADSPIGRLTLEAFGVIAVVLLVLAVLWRLWATRQKRERERVG